MKKRLQIVIAIALVSTLGAIGVTQAGSHKADKSGGLKGQIADIQNDLSNIENRVTVLEDSAVSQPDFGGYGTPFSADGLPKNVTVLKRESGGSTSYYIRSRYATSSEQISVNGVMTQRPLIANYGFVQVDFLGDVVFVSNYIEAPDTEEYINFVVEESIYDLPSLNKNVTADSLQESWLCSGAAAQLCLVSVSQSADGAHVSSYGWNAIRSLAGPFDVDGLSFDDVRLEELLNRDTTRVRAKGIGEILRISSGSERRLIYYRVDGQQGGSLAGTPFESGQLLNGLLF